MPISHLAKAGATKMGSQGCHLSLTSKFPDSSLTFYSFPYFLSGQKIIFILYLNGANYITSNLGVTFKGKNLLPSFRVAPPMKREMGLDYLMRKYILSSLEQNK